MTKLADYMAALPIEEQLAVAREANEALKRELADVHQHAAEIGENLYDCERERDALSQEDGKLERALERLKEQYDEQSADLAAAKARDKQWFEFACAVGERTKCWASSFPDANDHILKSIDAARAKLEECGRALREYGCHKGGCSFMLMDEPTPCDCGFRQLLSVLDKQDNQP